jgi:hypothetical protein
VVELKEWLLRHEDLDDKIFEDDIDKLAGILYVQCTTIKWSNISRSMLCVAA